MHFIVFELHNCWFSSEVERGSIIICRPVAELSILKKRYVVGSFEGDSHKVMLIGKWSLEWYVVGSFEGDSHKVMQIGRSAVLVEVLRQIHTW